MTPEQESLVHGIYACGLYNSESEVLTEALRLLEQRDRLRSELNLGISELNEGKILDGAKVFESLRQRVSQLESERE